MLLEMKDEAEIVIVISADDMERSKRRGDLGITYDEDALRLIDAFRSIGLYVGSVSITHYRGQQAADVFRKRPRGHARARLYAALDTRLSLQPLLIVSDEGFGRNDYIETSRQLVVVTAPGPGSGKMAPASPSYITSTSAASRPATRSLRPSRYGTSLSSTRSTSPTRPPPPTSTTSI